MSIPGRSIPVDEFSRGRHAIGYYRLERWEIPPPPGSDLPSELEGRAPVDDHQRSSAGGLTTGGLLTNIDSMGGMVCGFAVQPDWVVTTNLMARVMRTGHIGPLRFGARVLRRGRSSVLCAVDVVDEGDDEAPVASAVGTFAVLDPGGMTLDLQRPLVIPMPPFDPTVGPPEEFFQIDPGTGSTTRLQMADHLLNHWGIVHGGVTANLVDIAATRVVRAVREVPVASADTMLHYLSPGRVGPLEARCRIMGSRSDGTVVRVTVHDLGVDGRQVALASVTVRDV